jgi:hypothetical protein
VTQAAVPQPGRLHGRVGLITGAASGIGAAGAELFAAQLAALVLVDVDRAAHPLGRFADPAEVARAALFLSCAESSFTTGAPLLVDEGVTARPPWVRRGPTGHRAALRTRCTPHNGSHLPPPGGSASPPSAH